MNKFEITDAHKEVMYGMSITQASKINRIKINSGHELYKMEITNGTVSKVDCVITNRRVNITTDLNYLYASALNLKNAYKKFARILIYVNFMVYSTTKAETILSSTILSSLKGVGQINSDKSII